MNRPTRILLGTLAILVTLAALVIVGANLYIQSPGTQARIQAGLSKALRMPVTFRSTSISMAGRLKVLDIVIPDGERRFLEAAAFTAHYRLGALLRGRLEIHGMSVERPRIVWQQNGEGHWVVPRQAEEAKAPPAEKKPAPATADDGGRKSGLDVVVEGFRIHGGSVELLDKKGEAAATFHGVNVLYTTLSAETMEGNAHVERLGWGQGLTFENVRTPFRYAAQELTLPELTATLAGGAVTGKFTMKTGGKKVPFTLSLALDRIDAGLLSAQMHSALGKAAGAIGGTLEMHGNARDLEDAEGTGTLHVRDGRVQQLELFEVIGDVLEIRELSDLGLKEGRANFRLGNGRAFVDEFLLEAANLQLSAKGEVRFDGRIKLASKLAIDGSLRKHLPGLIRGNFEKEGDQRYAIAFDIKGERFRMKTNLLDRIVGKKLTSQVDDLLTSLFGKKKEEKKEEKMDDKKKSDEAKDDKKKDAGNKPKAPPVPAAPAGAPAAAPVPAAPEPRAQ